jgi:alpha-ribazole phosphatase/probable phosphoglycerate mutase
MGSMSTEKTIFLIRHAETDFAGTFCGHSDPPVDAKGRLQIEQLLLKLEQNKIDTIYTSDLQRALTTAEAIAARLNAPLHVTSNLREIGFGDWESFTWEQIQHRDPVFAKHWTEEFPNLPAPNGEEFASFERRILSEFDAIAATNRNAAIVTHAGVLRVILTQRCGSTNEQAWLQTKAHCCVVSHTIGDGGQ